MEELRKFKVLIDPSPSLQLVWNRRTAVIDFSGDTVTYSGDIPIDEAARVFFEAVFQQFKQYKTLL